MRITNNYIGLYSYRIGYIGLLYNFLLLIFMYYVWISRFTKISVCWIVIIYNYEFMFFITITQSKLLLFK